MQNSLQISKIIWGIWITSDKKWKDQNLYENYIPSAIAFFPDLSNITFNWPVVWKMTQWIWQFFPRALKIGILMGSFNPNLKMYQLKIHRGVICHDKQDYAKFEEEPTCHFKVNMGSLTQFWPEHLKVSKKLILMGCFWAKYILFQLKTYKGVIFHETGEGCKIWRGINL